METQNVQRKRLQEDMSGKTDPSSKRLRAVSSFTQSQASHMVPPALVMVRTPLMSFKIICKLALTKWKPGWSQTAEAPLKPQSKTFSVNMIRGSRFGTRTEDS